MSRIINVKVVFILLCPLPIHPSLSTLPRVKQFCCCLVDYQSRPALPCKASQGKKKKTFFLAKTTLSLCDSRATGFPPKSSWKSPVASPSELAEPKMNPKINFLFAEQTFGSHMFVCTLTLPGQNPDADLSENRTGSVCKTSLLKIALSQPHPATCGIVPGRVVWWVQSKPLKHSRSLEPRHSQTLVQYRYVWRFMWCWYDIVWQFCSCSCSCLFCASCVHITNAFTSMFLYLSLVTTVTVQVFSPKTVTFWSIKFRLCFSRWLFFLLTCGITDFW